MATPTCCAPPSRAGATARLRVFAISVLTSQDEAALQAMGYDRPLQDIVDLRRPRTPPRPAATA